MIIVAIVFGVFVVAFGLFAWTDWGVRARRLWTLRGSIPEFRAPLVVSDPIFSQELVRQLKDQAVAAVKQLDADQLSFDGWMQLAAIRKIAGDLRGAAAAWEFAHTLQPKNSLPLHNLGNLYGYEFHDAIAAEEYFRRALPLGPNDIALYRSAYEFYRFIKKDDTAARVILEEGIALNPLNDQDFQNLLSSF